MSRSHDIHRHSVLDALPSWEIRDWLRLHVGYARLKDTVLQLFPRTDSPLWRYLLALLFKAIPLIRKSWWYQIRKDFLKPDDLQYGPACLIYNSKHTQLGWLYTDKAFNMVRNPGDLFPGCTDHHSRAICDLWELAVFCDLLGCNRLFLNAHYSSALLQELY